MPNLVGIGNSQVPTNAMLGGLAYQDSVGEIDINKIKASTADTAVEIFVYDTRKDSDGGAWRKKTKNTSWYNEDESGTRGARKEFPAIAVIVMESTQCTIYDADDPNLSMWMIFNFGAGTALSSKTMFYAGGKTVFALNGMICFGGDSGWKDGVTQVKLIEDTSFWRNGTYVAYWTGGIANRNVAGGYGQFVTDPAKLIASNQVNDIAMTVLHNAPIDASTGLPVPTIAVATNGGTNVINHDGTVTEGYQTIATQNVDLHPDGFMTDGVTGAVNDSFSFYKITQTDRLVSYGHRADTQVINTFLNEGTGECLFEGKSNKIAIAQSQGLLRIAEEIDIERTNDAVSLGLHNRTASSYNTGWMVADVKGAFLSSTDATDVTGSELVTNGDFAANSNWTYQGSGAGWSISSGRLNYDGSGTLYHKAYQNITGLTVGQKYVLSINLVSISSHSISFAFATSNIGNTLSANTVSTTGTHSITWSATQTNISVYVQTNHATQTFSVDDFSLRIAEEDRSVNDNGLQVFGTVTKRVVEAGAELVSYNNLTSSNYLEQPYNSDLDFGTGDFCMIGWFYNLGLSSSILYRLHNSTTVGTGYIVALSSGGELGYSSYTQGFRSTGRITHYTTDTWNGRKQWNMFVCGKKDGYGYTYVNGILKQTAINANSHTDTTYKPPLRIGNNYAGNGGIGGGKLALIRISSTFPSEKQIKKMYNDEKRLFAERAKCAFHGTSDNVKSIAYDDTNDILHVGTSGGRSDFRGLNRINNTTTAVTTSISASNGLVAEQ